MKRTDIERMISLADDRYIDEIFQDKITGRRRNIFVTFTAVAAALALTAGGISYFVSNADKSNDITTDMPAVSNEDITDNTETEPAIQNVSSSDFFKNKSDYPASFYIEWSSEFHGDKQMSFDETYVKTILPFSAEGYSKTRDQFYLYMDENDIPFGASIYFESPFDENASPKIKSISVNVCDKGKLSYPFDIEEFEPINYMYTDIYGFDDTEGYSYTDVYESVLTAYFTAGGSEYSVSTVNLSAEETMHIVESLIQSSFSAKNFDIKDGYDFSYKTEEMSLAEANTIKPFAGHIPQIEENGTLYLYKGVTYAVEKSEGENIWSALYFSFVDYSNENNRILFNYFTSEKGDTEAFDNIFDLQNITQDSLNNFKVGDEYKFTLDCGEFMINVTAECTSEQLWKYIEAINGNSYEEISLAEANNIAPYSGFVPQSEKVGDMKLGLVQYNGSNIVLDYSFQSENRFSYIGLTYTIDKDLSSNYAVMTIEQLTEGDIVFERYDGDDGRHNYTFAVDCKGMYGRFYVCIDGNNCTTAELYDCILTLLMDKSSLAGDKDFNFTPFGTLEEANKLEPFAGYVPTAKEIGDMKIYTGYGSEVRSAVTEENERMLRINYQSEVKSGNVYGEYDFKAIGATYTEKKYYIDTTDPVISVEKLPWADLDDLKTDGIRPDGRVCYRFIIDCGTCYISVAADCLPEEMKQFIGEITGTAVHDAADEDVKILTMDKVRELAKKGDDLTWSDFDGYTFTEGGSGLYIKSYAVEGGYNLMIGGEGRETKPMYIYLTGNGKQRIDIRYDSIDDFLVDDKGENLLTMDKVKELAKKGGDLTWSDFEAFDGEDMGSGIYIMVYHVEGTDYTVVVGGGSLDRKPDYIRLGDENGNYIDIRYDSVDDFLKDKPFINFEF